MQFEYDIHRKVLARKGLRRKWRARRVPNNIIISPLDFLALSVIISEVQYPPYLRNLNMFVDSQEGFDMADEARYEAEAENYGHEEMEFEVDREDYQDDGQPSEYDEWQDLYGGDDWDHGQYDYDGE